MIREVLYTCVNVPEIGTNVDIFVENNTLHAAFNKPYAFDPKWAALDDLVTSACNQEASWSALNTLTVLVGPEPIEKQARELWVTLATAQKQLFGLMEPMT